LSAKQKQEICQRKAKNPQLSNSELGKTTVQNIIIHSEKWIRYKLNASKLLTELEIERYKMSNYLEHIYIQPQIQYQRVKFVERIITQAIQIYYHVSGSADTYTNITNWRNSA